MKSPFFFTVERPNLGTEGENTISWWLKPLRFVSVCGPLLHLFISLSLIILCHVASAKARQKRQKPAEMEGRNNSAALVGQDEKRASAGRTETGRNIRPTHILENWLPLFPRTNGIGTTHHQAVRVDAEVPAISRLQGYPAPGRTRHAICA